MVAARRVLLVEDESLVAMVVEDILTELGWEVILAMRLDAGLCAAREAAVHIAVLDVNLGEGRSYPIADVLRQRKIPFLFATGYGLGGLEAAYRDVPVLQKPYRPSDLARVIGELMGPCSASSAG